MRKTPLYVEGRFYLEQSPIEHVSSDLEDFSEGHYIGRQGKGSDPMPFRG